MALYLGSKNHYDIVFTDPQHPADEIQFSLRREPRWPTTSDSIVMGSVLAIERVVWHPLHTFLHRMEPGRSTRIHNQGTPSVEFVRIGTEEAAALYQEHLDTAKQPPP